MIGQGQGKEIRSHNGKNRKVKGAYHFNDVQQTLRLILRLCKQALHIFIGRVYFQRLQQPGPRFGIFFLLKLGVA
jgi:hypothetical protein